MTEILRDHQYAGAAPQAQPTVPTPTHAAYARTLLQGQGLATLATLRTDGHPFSSLVQYVLDERGRPTTLISELAEHTKNVRNDPRTSMMIASNVRAGDDPMALPRVTLLGTMTEVSTRSAELAGRFVATHPTASSYLAFGDFRFWTLDVRSVRYVGGYGRMSWIPVDEYSTTEPDPLQAHADAIVLHMNDDHADACLTYVQAFAGHADATSARLLGVDQHGMDLLAVTPEGLQPTRVAFDEPVRTPEAVRAAVVALLARARRHGVAP